MGKAALALLVLVMLSGSSHGAERETPPPSEPTAAESAPPENGTPLSQQKGIGARVHLLTGAAGISLYDEFVSAKLCDAPCDVLIPSGNHVFDVRSPNSRESRDFRLSDETGDLTIRYQPKNNALFAFGLVNTIIGAVGVVGGAATLLVWGVVLLFGNALLALAAGLSGGGVTGWAPGYPWVFLFSGVAATVGAPFLISGLVMVKNGDDKLTINDQIPPAVVGRDDDESAKAKALAPTAPARGSGREAAPEVPDTIKGALNPRANGDLLLQNASPFTWTQCDIRIPNHRVYRFPEGYQLDSDAKVILHPNLLAEDQRAPDPQVQSGAWALVRCAQGASYVPYDRGEVVAPPEDHWQN